MKKTAKKACITIVALCLILACPLTAVAAGENADNGENNIVEQTDNAKSETIGDENLAAEDELPPHEPAQNTSRNMLIFFCALIVLGALTERKISKFRN